MKQDEQLYQRGFNSGYLLSEYEPEIAEKIKSGTNPAQIYLTGFCDGNDQNLLEYEKAQVSELEELRQSLGNREQNLERE